jgi:hypothetical protein
MSDIDDTSTTPDDEQWLPIAELARIKGVARQTVWQKVTELESEGLLTTRPGPKNTKLVNVGEYEFRVRETADLVKEQAAATTRANFEDPALRDAQTRKLKIETALKVYELGERQGRLVDITRVNEVIAQVGEELRKPLDQLPLRADEVHAAAASGGAVAVRSKLRDIAFDLRGAAMEALRKLAELGNKSGSSPA